MRIQVKEEPFKAVLFWLSKQEAADKDSMDVLKATFPSLKQEGYLSVVYISGDGDLEESIYLLIKKHIYDKVCVLNEVITKTQTEWETNSSMQAFSLHTAVLLSTHILFQFLRR